MPRVRNGNAAFSGGLPRDHWQAPTELDDRCAPEVYVVNRVLTGSPRHAEEVIDAVVTDARPTPEVLTDPPGPAGMPGLLRRQNTPASRAYRHHRQ